MSAGVKIELSFIETFKKQDFKQVWIGLCQDDPGAKGVIRSYLRDDVESSQTTSASAAKKAVVAGDSSS